MSTDPATYTIFRNAVKPANRERSANNLATFAAQWDLDGINIDWEYPGARDIKDVPPASPTTTRTYLHRQWDYGNQWSDPGYPAGNCLRSHVTLAETVNALSMIIKAGVPSNKVVFGVSSYGRSFRMTTPSCTELMCIYTGPESGATPGRCTKTAGYISNAEI
ncbi:hypothetical protein N0V88_002425 [Collariella sp. IMI 366227]|nr:hypothetical protein N0V88_002425 [Collariella sp. IMI 366227]